MCCGRYLRLKSLGFTKGFGLANRLRAYEPASAKRAKGIATILKAREHFVAYL